MAVQDTPALQPSQVKSAVKALVAHLSKPKPADKNSKKSTPESLLGTDVFLWLILTTKKMPEKASMKPIPMYVFFYR